MQKIGIIGGSGLEKLDLFSQSKELDLTTHYGKPSSTVLSGSIGNHDVFIISRHGRDHNIPPTQVNNRANILVLKELGCNCIIATTACGSLREEIKRGDLAFPDQFIDFTRHRMVTFFEKFENQELKHTPMADPFSVALRLLFIEAAKKMKIPFHEKGTIITIEGPRFSTRAESRMFRMWGADVINMSTAPEAILANEAEIPYAVIAMSTDYDCWKTDEQPVTWDDILKVFKQNTEKVTALLVEVINNMK